MNNYGGFVLTKTSTGYDFTARSGLNTLTFLNPPSEITRLDQWYRPLPPAWAEAVEACLAESLLERPVRISLRGRGA